MSDEVPAEVERLQRVNLVQAFLHAVLAEFPLAGQCRRADIVWRKCLRDGKEENVSGDPMRPFGRRGDAATNGREAIGNVGVRHPSTRRSSGRLSTGACETAR